MHHIVVTQRSDVSRYLLHQIEYRKFRRRRRFEYDQATDSGNKNPAVRHGMDITHTVTRFLRIIREIIRNSDEFISVRIRKHGQGPSEGTYPDASIIVLTYGINIVGTEGITV